MVAVALLFVVAIAVAVTVRCLGLACCAVAVHDGKTLIDCCCGGGFLIEGT